LFYVVVLAIVGVIGARALRMGKAIHAGGAGPLSWLYFALTIAPPLLLALFLVSVWVLHGDALTGKVVGDRYFVHQKGDYAEVSHGAFLFSLWLGRVTIGSFVVGLAASLLGNVVRDGR